MMPRQGESDPFYGATDGDETLRRAFRGGGVETAVYGLGKMGLPVAAVFADVTGNTVGVDIDERVVGQINDGQCPVEREPGLPELVEDVVERGALVASTDPATVASGATVHVVVVPTLLTDDDRPDLSLLEAAAEAIGRGLDPGDVVFVESTVPPGTCSDVVLPIVSAESGLAESEFGLAACPERSVSGQAVADVRGTHPKVVGGVDDESSRVAKLVYSEVSSNDVIVVSDATTAEAVKVFEGVYRDVNIALANQLSLYSRPLDIDVPEAIDVANTQPFCDIHDPGPGVGGHCIPVYPYFLSNAFDVDAPVLDVAREVTDSMPEHAAEMVRYVLQTHGSELRDSRVLLLGVTYKADVAELRNAPSIPLARELRASGGTVLAVDPLVEDWSQVPPVDPVSFEERSEHDVDLVFLVTPHQEFQDLDWDSFDAPVIDGRRAIDPDATDVPLYRIGGKWD